jgi:hypothetical protein
MKSKLLPAAFGTLFLLTLTFSLTAASSYHTISVDGDLNDFLTDEHVETSSGYDLYLTWDATNLYIGLSDAILSDALGDYSFFVAIDVDQTASSGATSDGYSRVNFTGDYLPEYGYYFAGGAGWYERSTWNGSSWDWNTWTNTGTFYHWSGNTATIPGSEFTIPWSDIDSPSEIALYAWLTEENNANVVAAWDSVNPTGASPTFYDPYYYPDLGSGIPTAVTLSDLSARATSPALLGASVLLLGAVIVWRRKRA